MNKAHSRPAEDAASHGDAEVGPIQTPQIGIYDKIALGSCVGLVLATVLFFLYEHFVIDDPQKAHHTTWTALIVLAALPSVFVLLIWYWRKKDNDRAVLIVQKRHLNGRLETAIHFLGDRDAAVRMGGIYSLERLINAEPNKTTGWSLDDHNSVIEILTGYVRAKISSSTDTTQSKPTEALQDDVRTVLTVLSRRRWATVPGEISLDFEYANLKEANLREIRLRSASFAYANLRGISLISADLQSVNFCEAKLQKANLQDADLTGADFTRAFLSGANFQGAVLREANFGGASLSGARFAGADLEGAILEGAILEEANLAGAKLDRARLSGADLSAANLKGVEFGGADLKGAYYSRSTRFPKGFNPDDHDMTKND